MPLYRQHSPQVAAPSLSTRTAPSRIASGRQHGQRPRHREQTHLLVRATSSTNSTSTTSATAQHSHHCPHASHASAGSIHRSITSHRQRALQVPASSHRTSNSHVIAQYAAPSTPTPALAATTAPPSRPQHQHQQHPQRHHGQGHAISKPHELTGYSICHQRPLSPIRPDDGARSLACSVAPSCAHRRQLRRHHYRAAAINRLAVAAAAQLYGLL